MNPKHFSAVIGALTLIGGLYAWAESVAEVGHLNQQSISSIEKREDLHREIHQEHRADHLIFKAEYREDQARVERKLDRLLEQIK
tara:strand:- start:1665 stop:1919 length:255 start_codon:yes stop_codon:yes gene_type:complete